MHDTEQPRRGRRVPRAVTAAALGLLAFLASFSLFVGTSSTASAAELTPQQAAAISQQLATQVAVQPMLHPSCVDGACGVELSPSETQAVWKAVVNQPITWIRNYCRGLFGGALTPFCDAAAQFLSNASAPNGRCLFAGIGTSSTGAKVVVKYTTTFCY